MKKKQNTPDLRTLKLHPEGGLVFPNGVRVAMAHRNITGRPGDEQYALVDEKGNVYSPIFKSIEEANRWLKENAEFGFVPLDGTPTNN